MLRLVLLALVVGLGCAPAVAVAQDGSLLVNLTRTRTALGVVNTELLPIGSLLVRERGADKMTLLDTLDIPPDALQRPQSAGLISVNLSSGVAVGVSVSFLSSSKAAAIAAEAKRQLKFFVKDVTTERLKSPLATINSPSIKAQRAFYASFYGDGYVYELVFDVKRVNEGGIGFGRPFKVDGKLGFPQTVRLQGLQFSVAYDNASSLEFGGNQAPMFYRTQTYELVKAGDDYRFVPASEDEE
ncbi:MAG: hypothetical protein ACOYLQ_01860 [Hyphomicrobiaceae bacterium]